MAVSSISPNCPPGSPKPHPNTDPDAKIRSLEQKLQTLQKEKQKAVQNKDQDKKEKLEKQIREIEKQLQQLRQEEKRQKQEAVPDISGLREAAGRTSDTENSIDTYA